MKNRLIFIFAWCIIVCNVYAQHSLSGNVKDRASGTPIEFVTITLLGGDSTVVTGTMTDSSGGFRLENIQTGKYLIRMSFIGYETEYRKATVPTQGNLGEILLSESANRLGEVVVTAKQPFVVQQIDRYVVNVGHILTAGRNALDVLRNTPGVLVTPDGSISVMGNSVEIWIDGRPSRLSSEALKALLNSMQGETIDKIEVITNPSARYDASGGNIINIKTKKGLKYGVNGSLNANYRQGHNDMENTGIALNFRETRINLFGNYSFERNSPWIRIHQINKTKTSDELVAFDQYTDGNTAKAYGNHNYRVGADFFLNEKHTIGILFNGYTQGRGEERLNGNTTITPIFDGVASSTSEGIVKEKMHSGLANANYQGNFGKRQLNINLDYAGFDMKPFQYSRNEYFDTQESIIGQPEELRHTNPQTIKLWSATVDYTTSLWKESQIEIGGKLSGSQTDNDLRYETVKNGKWEIDTDQTNRFVYTENINAAYISLAQSFGKWAFQAGLRGEYTGVKGEQRTLGTSEESSYFGLFPTFFARYQPSEKHTWGLSYGRRIRRPSYTLLNPFEVKIDAYSYAAGNPDLLPSYTHNIQLSYMYNTFMLRLTYNRTTGQIAMTPVIDAATGRHGLIPMNFSKRQNITLSPNYRLSATKFWTINLWGEAAYVMNRSPEASGEFNNDGFLFVGSMGNQFVITPTLVAEVNGFFFSGQRLGYFKHDPTGNVSVGIQKTLLKNKLAIAISANDLFYTSISKSVAQYEKADYQVKESGDSRWINISVRYNFGSDKVKPSRNRSTGIEDETSRVK
ncbi:MAG: TonB-dependent receptor [Dysgonamonadaceae bacterium]|jgi:hypothetical protein|nr:TonB-dependent receptor [Dysgonamonadaceae bacterium]